MLDTMRKQRYKEQMLLEDFALQNLTDAEKAALSGVTGNTLTNVGAMLPGIGSLVAVANTAGTIGGLYSTRDCLNSDNPDYMDYVPGASQFRFASRRVDHDTRLLKSKSPVKYPGLQEALGRLTKYLTAGGIGSVAGYSYNTYTGGDSPKLSTAIGGLSASALVLALDALGAYKGSRKGALKRDEERDYIQNGLEPFLTHLTPYVGGYQTVRRELSLLRDAK